MLPMKLHPSFTDGFNVELYLVGCYFKKIVPNVFGLIALPVVKLCFNAIVLENPDPSDLYLLNQSTGPSRSVALQGLIRLWSFTSPSTREPFR